MKTNKVFQLSGSEKKQYGSVEIVVLNLEEPDVVTTSGEGKLLESGGEWISAWE